MANHCCRGLQLTPSVVVPQHIDLLISRVNTEIEDYEDEADNLIFVYNETKPFEVNITVPGGPLEYYELHCRLPRDYP
jgi:hypothetical protein